ncbi:hypothetical protein ACFY0G_01980 [Streptomyces sp. NPDC001552]|uniref:hypothetical protein n=1 Tax=Streptomyces sp. NPDC001552 TaxID=3364587 RepID=UPI0036B02A0A
MTLKTLPGHELTVLPRHPDGTPCAHELTEHGKALEAGCTGREDYVGVCACAQWWETDEVHGLLDARHARHLRELAGGES